ncbi:MAG: PAS domain S-box protein [Saprospiraceae bacterium]
MTTLIAFPIGPEFQAATYPVVREMLLSRVPIIICFWWLQPFTVRFIGYQETTGIQEGRFEALFEYASNGILVANQGSTLTMSNPALNKLFGYQEGELTGQKVEELIPHRFSGKHRQYRKGYHEDPKPRSMGQNLNLSGRKKDGSEFPVEVSLSPFKNKDGEFVVAFVIDNTFRKNYEKSILKQKQELANLSNALQELNDSLENKVSERTQELEQAKNDLSIALEKERELGELKSRFVSMASHEFRTPLTTILSSAGLIRQCRPAGSEQCGQTFRKNKKCSERQTPYLRSSFRWADFERWPGFRSAGDLHGSWLPKFPKGYKVSLSRVKSRTYPRRPGTGFY